MLRVSTPCGKGDHSAVRQCYHIVVFHSCCTAAALLAPLVPQLFRGYSTAILLHHYPIDRWFTAIPLLFSWCFVLQSHRYAECHVQLFLRFSIAMPLGTQHSKCVESHLEYCSNHLSVRRTHFSAVCFSCWRGRNRGSRTSQGKHSVRVFGA